MKTALSVILPTTLAVFLSLAWVSIVAPAKQMAVMKACREARVLTTQDPAICDGTFRATRVSARAVD